MKRALIPVVAALLALAAHVPSALTAVRDTTPQGIRVFVNCVTNHAGTYDATFGYQNGNARAATVPIGNDNYFTPGPPNRGQPSTFQPGISVNAVTVSGIPNGTDLDWVLSFGGQVQSARASASFATKCQPAPQPIHVFVDCVTNHASTFDATFGYQSDNPVPEAVPVASGNSFTPPPADRGQPTTFQPGAHHNIFTVSGVPNGTSLVWTLSFGGQTSTTTASDSLATKCQVPPPLPPSGRRVTICHRTHSKQHPFVEITVDRDALAAHLRHGDLRPGAAGCPSRGRARGEDDDLEDEHGDHHGQDHQGHHDGGREEHDD